MSGKEEYVPCPVCKTEILIGSKFCFECGTNLLIHDKFQDEINESNITIKIDDDLIKQFQAVNQELSELMELDDEITAQEEHHLEISNHYRTIQNRFLELKKRIHKEKQDVKDLEKFSLSNLISKIKGNLDEKISKEQAEFIEWNSQLVAVEQEKNKVKIQLDTAKKQNDRIRGYKRKKKGLEIERKKILDVLKESIEHKEADKLDNEIAELRKEIEPYRKKLNSLKSAHSSAKTAANNFRDASSILDGAKSWSTLDLLGGGGLFVDSIKNSKINNARKDSNAGNRNLNRAMQSYKAAGGSGTASQGYVDTSGQTMDIIFDGLFVDWSQRNKLNNSISSVGSARRSAMGLMSRIKETMGPLEKRYYALNEQIREKEQELEKLRVQLLERYITDKKIKI